jgi:hypothetical protein
VAEDLDPESVGVEDEERVVVLVDDFLGAGIARVSRLLLEPSGPSRST